MSRVQSSHSAKLSKFRRPLDNSHIDPLRHEFQRIKSAIHQEFIASLDLSRMGDLDQVEVWAEVRSMAEHLCESRAEMLSQVDRERMIDDLMDEIFGLGPIERLMRDPSVTDILVNDPFNVYVERNGRLELTDVAFADDDHLMRIIQRVAGRVGRRVDEVSPMVDARLPDGSRVNAIVPPLALQGPAISIRRFGSKPLEIDDLQRYHSILPEMVQFMQAAVEARVGFLVSGGTGAGKTTLLNAMSRFIPKEERLVTIEDSAELILQHRHVVRLETRPENTEGAGAITQRELVRNSLRMRPDRIIVGEVRGPEVWDMLQAMNTGHEGSLTTIHANDTRDALTRMEMMCAMTGFDMPVPVVRQYIATGIKLIIQLSRLKGGPRRVLRISEIVGVVDGQYEVQDIYGFEQTGVGPDGVAKGYFYATGYVPACLKRFKAAGIELPGKLFEARQMTEII